MASASLQEVDGGRPTDEPRGQWGVGLQGVSLHQKAPGETETGSVLEPPRMWGAGGPATPRQDTGSMGWGPSGREQDAPLPKWWREGTASRQRGLEGQRPRGRTPGVGTRGKGGGDVRMRQRGLRSPACSHWPRTSGVPRASRQCSRTAMPAQRCPRAENVRASTAPRPRLPQELGAHPPAIQNAGTSGESTTVGIGGRATPEDVPGKRVAEEVVWEKSLSTKRESFKAKTPNN